MSFDRAELLWLLLGIPPLLLLEWARFRRCIPGLIALLPRASALPYDAEASVRRRFVGSILAFAACLAFLTLALAGPSWGERLIREPRSGADIVLAIDLSRSMDCRDVGPSRLARATAFARELVDACQDCRFAVALGRGDGVLALPLGDDRESVGALLRSLGTRSMSGAGTDLDKLLEAAASAFVATQPTRRVIVLFSDGESLSGAVAQRAEALAREGVLVSALCVGTEGGAKVPLLPGDGWLAVNGEPVISYARPETLRAAASRGGGRFWDGNRMENISAAAAYLHSLVDARSAEGVRRESVPRHGLFLLLALLCFAASRAIELSRWRRA